MAQEMSVEEKLEAFQNAIPLFTNMDHMLVAMAIDDDGRPHQFHCACYETFFTEIQFLRHQLQSLQQLDLNQLSSFSTNKINELVEDNEYSNKTSGSKKQEPEHGIYYKPLSYYKQRMEKKQADGSNVNVKKPDEAIKSNLTTSDERADSIPGTSLQVLKKIKLESTPSCGTNVAEQVVQTTQMLTTIGSTKEEQKPQVDLPMVEKNPNLNSKDKKD